ncbi:sterol desaturase family protein [Mesorhizobium sp. M1348]|uniref:sterol desaturase family protein n=1 Tax=Mesorhizobium sp. M1348 TaxID=2957089 RepID=UPI003336CB91
MGFSVLTWLYLSPSLETARTFSFDWIAFVYLRNLGLMVLVAGGMHLYLYTFKMQGSRLRYDARPFHKKSALFTFNNQFLDNVFWSIASGVTVWTAYEVIGLWAYANGYMPMLDFGTHPVWFALWFVLMPFYTLTHFYWIHRLLHWGPLYNYVHSLHHRNVNVGPWSGMSMHPIEHVIYMSSVVIHLVLPSHPIHFLFHLQQKVLLAVSSHGGYESVTATEDSDAGLTVGDFFHQLHHRYFECNYGGTEVPLDAWFGTFHDGSEEATARTRLRMKEMRKK